MIWKRDAALACAITVVGCVLAIDEVVPPQESEFDPALIGLWEGTWEGDSAAASAVITTADTHTYLIDYTAEDGERTGSFEARLGRLGDRVALEVWPAEDDGYSTVQDDLAVPGHQYVSSRLGWLPFLPTGFVRHPNRRHAPLHLQPR